ncbi:carbonic anhydrase 7 isoform X2 [Phyllobates terribilis]|uniref:carbonic anhydrase 7 isoform X2 n=1 Tax=Phyllobates terribilis TaxID=111132 RepID=UPI003CCAF107
MTGQHCWGYGEEDGPSEWHRYFPIAQGNRQSPINIVASQAVFNPSLQPLVVSYDQCTSINMSNNGHSVMVEFDDNDDKTVITGGPLNDSYRLKQFHFHWGTQVNEGSEHTVDGKSYPCELHLVHWNAKSFPSFGEAAAASDGLVVIGVFLEIGEKHPGLDRLTDALYMVRFRMERFRKTLLFNGEEEDERIHMVNNFRPPQPLNGRKVQASFKC